jgi:hypothetical protein
MGAFRGEIGIFTHCPIHKHCVCDSHFSLLRFSFLLDKDLLNDKKQHSLG